MNNENTITLESTDDNYIPEGREIAENIFNICNDMNTQEEPVEDPYYWEPDYPIDDPRQLHFHTIISHNLYYMFSTVKSWCVGAGNALMDFFGWNQSNYEWIVQDIALDKEEKEQEEMQKLEQYTKVLKRRQRLLKDEGKDLEKNK